MFIVSQYDTRVINLWITSHLLLADTLNYVYFNLYHYLSKIYYTNNEFYLNVFHNFELKFKKRSLMYEFQIRYEMC